MIELEYTKVTGWETAIRGCRNPLNSWDRSDSMWSGSDYLIGANDLTLMKRLAVAGSDHAKFLRMINVTVDITAPIYWFSELDTYKVGTVRNSCSFMHKGTSARFDLSNFNTDFIEPVADMMETEMVFQNEYFIWENIVNHLNRLRDLYLETKDDRVFQEIRSLLPSGYLQRSTLQMNYAVLRNIYHSRKNHRLQEWKDFCKWIERLPYSELITLTTVPEGE